LTGFPIRVESADATEDQKARGGRLLVEEYRARRDRQAAVKRAAAPHESVTRGGSALLNSLAWLTISRKITFGWGKNQCFDEQMEQ
jgi:hypothetical protein